MSGNLFHKCNIGLYSFAWRHRLVGDYSSMVDVSITWQPSVQRQMAGDSAQAQSALCEQGEHRGTTRGG